MTLVAFDLPSQPGGDAAPAPDWRRAAQAMEGRILSYSERKLPVLLQWLAFHGAAEGLGALGGVVSRPGGSIAVLRIEGFLAERGAGPNPEAGGYEEIRARLAAALADPQVRGIALVFDSDGGEISGALDTAEAIYRARKVKPIWSIVSYRACGTACLLATAANVVIVGSLGTMGGIGALQLRFDLSRAYATEGIVMNPITFGKRKADGLPFLPMSKPERAQAQRDVDAIGTMFVNAVARFRGMRPEKVLAQQAATFMDAKAVRAGLADRIAKGFPIDELEGFRSFLTRLGTGGPAAAAPTRSLAAPRRLPARTAPAHHFVFRGIGRG